MNLRFRSLDIKMFPGFPMGEGFKLEDLDHDVVLVVGPNGSGKSTTAKALQSVIWPKTGVTVEAKTSLGGVAHDVTVQFGSAKWSADGQDASLPSFGEKEDRIRYWLSLDELVSAKGGQFADYIARQLLGGVNFGEARGSAQRKIKSPKSDLQALGEAQRAVTAAQRASAAVEEVAVKLTECRQERAEIVQKLTDSEQLQLAHRYRTALIEFEIAEDRLYTFDPKVGELFGNEVTTIERIESEIAGYRSEVERAERELRNYSPDRSASCIPHPFSPDVSAETKARINRLRDLESDLRSEEEKLVASKREAQIIRSRIAKELGVTPESVRPEAFTEERTDQLAERFKKAIHEREQAKALQEVKEFLLSEEGPKSDVFAELVRVLLEWLREADVDSSPTLSPGSDASRPGFNRTGLLIFAGLLFSAGLIISVLGHLWALFFIGLSAGPLALVLFEPKAPTPVTTPVVDRRPEIQRRFASYSIPIEDWKSPDWSDRSSVISCLNLLIEEQAKAKTREARQVAWQARERQLQGLLEGLEQRNAEREAIVTRGDLTSLPEWESLSLILNLSIELTRTEAVCSGAAELVETICSQIGTCIAQIQEALRPFGHADPTDSVTAAARLESIVHWDSASARKITAETAISQCRERISEVYRDCGLEDENLDELKALLQEKQAFTEAKADRDGKESALRLIEADVDKSKGFYELDLETLRSHIAELTQATSRKRELDEIILGIERSIEEDKKAVSVEKSLGEYEAIKDSILLKRDAQIRSGVGAIFSDIIEKECKSTVMPDVFERANQRFQSITQGAYRLGFSQETSGSEFTAFDAKKGLHQELDQLSIGTRIQLILSVRLAFIELSESVALPIIMDETLATTDPERCAAIVSLVSSMCKEGRQVFYFTSQPEEAARWEQALDGTQVSLKKVDLTEVRKLSTPNWQNQAPTAVKMLPDPISPASDCHESYGRQLGVAPIINPYQSGGTHLWHLFDDPHKLYETLKRSRRQEWGPTESQVRVILPGDAGDRIAAMGRLLTHASNLFKIGRPAPISEADFTGISIGKDSLQKLIAEWGDLWEDPNGLYRALEGSFLGFRPTTKDKIRQHMLDHDLIDLRAPMEPQAMMDEVAVQLREDLDSGLITRSDIERIVNRLPFHRTSSRLMS